MAATGTPVFDALALTTIEINLMDKSMTAEAAFVNTKNGATHGWTKGTGSIWSEDTKAAVATLVALMEQDLAQLHFGTIQAAQGLAVPTQPASGLGEHLADGDGTRSV